MPDPGFTSMTPVPDGTRRQSCAGVPLQENRSTGLSPVLAPLPTSRHLPLIRTVPSAWVCHACAALPLQLQMSTLVLSAARSPLSSRHMPAIPDIIGPDGSVHDWFA